MSPGEYHLFPALNKIVAATNLTRHAMYILRHAHATTMVVEKQYVFHIYSECVFVALGIQHAMCMHHTIICGLYSSTKLFHSIS